MTTRTEQAIQAITLYHDLLCDSDQNHLWEIAQRGLRKAVSVGKAQIVSSPNIPKAKIAFTGPIGLVTVLKQAQLSPSTSEAKRLISIGSVKVNDEVVQDATMELTAGTYDIAATKDRRSTITVQQAA